MSDNMVFMASRTLGMIRLKKLGRALLNHSEDLAEKLSFDFSVLYRENSCGTSGCAIGHCPLVFPREWSLADPDPDTPGIRSAELTKLKGLMTWHACASLFFSLTNEEIQYLFVPRATYGTNHLDQLPPGATAAQVGQRLIDFADRETAGL